MVLIEDGSRWYCDGDTFHASFMNFVVCISQCHGIIFYLTISEGSGSDPDDDVIFPCASFEEAFRIVKSIPKTATLVDVRAMKKSVSKEVSERMKEEKVTPEAF